MKFSIRGTERSTIYRRIADKSITHEDVEAAEPKDEFRDIRESLEIALDNARRAYDQADGPSIGPFNDWVISSALTLGSEIEEAINDERTEVAQTHIRRMIEADETCKTPSDSDNPWRELMDSDLGLESKTADDVTQTDPETQTFGKTSDRGNAERPAQDAWTPTLRQERMQTSEETGDTGARGSDWKKEVTTVTQLCGWKQHQTGTYVVCSARYAQRIHVVCH